MNIFIPQNEIKYKFIKASGPGGQNINKVSSGVQLIFDIRNSSILSERVKERLITIGGRKVTNNGILIIEAKRFRTQAKNKEDAYYRLKNMIFEARKNKKRRIRTSPSKQSVENRIEMKKQKSLKKKLRKRIITKFSIDGE